MSSIKIFSKIYLEDIACHAVSRVCFYPSLRGALYTHSLPAKRLSLSVIEKQTLVSIAVREVIETEGFGENTHIVPAVSKGGYFCFEFLLDTVLARKPLLPCTFYTHPSFNRSRNYLVHWTPTMHNPRGTQAFFFVVKLVITHCRV